MKQLLVSALGLVLGASSFVGCASEAADPTDDAAGDAGAAGDADVDLPEPVVVSLAAERGISVAEATQRIAWQDKLDDLETAVQDDARLATAFSAVWVDAARGDRIQVAVTADASAADVMAIARRLGIDAGTDVVRVARSQAQLQDIVDDLVSQTGEDANVAIGIDPTANAVTITVPADSAELRAIADAAAHRYGDAIRIVAAASATPAATSFDPPMRGGVKMHHATADATVYCTVGFFAHGTGRAHAPYILSAGHCVTDADNSGVWSANYANGSSHRLTNGGSYKVNAGGDMSALLMTNVSTWYPRPWIVVQKGPSTAYHPRYTIAANSASHVGTHVCHTGITSGTHCGTIQKLDVPITYDGHTIVGHQVQATMCGKSGDSGGPVFASHKAFGTYSATASGNGCVSYYEPINQVETQLGVAVAHCVPAGGTTSDGGNCCSMQAVYSNTPPNNLTCR